MLRTACSRIFYLLSLIFVAGLLVAADKPKTAAPKKTTPAKESAKSLEAEYRELMREYARILRGTKDEPNPDVKDPTKTRYVKADDPDLLKYAREGYLSASSVSNYKWTCVSQKGDVDKVRQELEEYKREEKPEPAVIRYLEWKVRKQQLRLRQYLNDYQVRKRDFAEYAKSGRVPVWIVEDYEKFGRDVKKPSRP